MPTDLAGPDGPDAAEKPLKARPVSSRKLFDLPLAVFWLTASVAVFTAYDTVSALYKFGVLTASILFFYVAAGQGGKYIRPAAISLIGLGAAIALVFLLQHDWQAQPADLTAINRIGVAWMAVRPSDWAAQTAPNRVGGLLAAFLPFAVLAIRSKQVGNRLFALVGGFMMAVGLVMTSSRAAWFALGAGTMVWLLWRLEAQLAAGGPAGYRNNRQTFRFVFAAGGALFAFVLLVQSAGILVWLDRLLPGVDSGLSRLRIVLNSLRLALDFPILGAGLDSFPGLYSEYILVTPNFYLGYSHNLYLDVAIEQGWIGLLALLSIFGLSLGACIAAVRQAGWDSHSGQLAQATFVALVGMLVHGFVDDAFYGETGTPFLFLLPGLAVAAALAAQDERQDLALFALAPSSTGSRRTSQGQRLRWLGAASLLLGVGVIAGFLGWLRPLSAVLPANLGAVQMARVQLSDFPRGGWDDGSDVDRLESAGAWLRSALQADPHNCSAAYRLGLLASLRRDYTAAAGFLESAYSTDRGHYGVMKNLAYTYVWLGRFEQARPLLQNIPEARLEMEAYSGWWRTQGRLDLAKRARAISQMELIP